MISMTRKDIRTLVTFNYRKVRKLLTLLHQVHQPHLTDVLGDHNSSVIQGEVSEKQ